MPRTKFTDDQRAAIEKAITGRKSVRAFLDRPVSREMVAHILEVASRAPSGTNMQPWRVHVVAGEARDKLSRAIHDSFTGGGRSPSGSEYKYYPDPFFEPFLSRRRKVGFDMYGLLGIKKGDTEAMAKQLGQNYLFFGAPVGLMFTIDRKLEIGSWLDYGYFLEAICVAARANGLETCSQQAFAYFHSIIREQLAMDDSEVVVCGMAMGYADWDATINKLQTVRAPVDEFATFRGF
ncbi:MAG: nitroreductase [Hyphomicrobiales bacterium]|nr:nitroreductase [Hyphomicrobiales bacterium]